jgi:hypothetical protein
MAARWNSRAATEPASADRDRMIRKTSVPSLRQFLRAVCLFMLFQTTCLCWSPSARAATVSDAYLAGYISSILERELYWPHASYTLQVTQGVATVTLWEENPEARRQAAERLKNINGLRAVHFTLAPASSDSTAASRTNSATPDQGIAYPVGDVFRPLLADPRQPHFYASLREYEMSSERMTTSSVGLGETFGLYRFAGRVPGDGVQISIEGGVFALFNLDQPTRELVNADYKVGVPITWRQGDNSLRLLLYHQSSHLGDGYLQRVQPQIVLLTYEAMSLLYSHDWQGLRVYLGGEYRVDSQPAYFKPWMWQGGVEYYGTQRLLGGMRLVAGVDIKCLEQHDYALDTNVQIGLEAGGSEPGQRRLRVVLEGYRGYSPDGQLFDNFIAAYGIGVHLGF